MSRDIFVMVKHQRCRSDLKRSEAASLLLAMISKTSCKGIRRIGDKDGNS